MPENVPDVSDSDIRRMVLRNHEPDETWSADGKLLSVHCAACYQSWPCPSRQAAWEAEKQAGREAMAWADAHFATAREAKPRRRWF